MTVKIEDKTVHIGWQAFVGILLFTVSTTWAISSGLNSIKDSVNGVRQEMHAAIDSVKNKQTQRAFQSDLKFQQIDDKLDRLVKKEGE